MRYKEIFALDDYLIYAELSLSKTADPLAKSAINNKPIPRWFLVRFFFKHKGRAWDVLFDIRCVFETPQISEITIGGVDHWVYPVWYLEKMAQGLPKTKQDDEKIGDYQLKRLISGVQRWQTEFIAQYQSQLFDRAVLMGLKYSANKKHKTYSATELKQLTKQVEKVTRREVTRLLLKQVAHIYTEAVLSYPPTSPIEAIMEHFNISHRRAQEYAKYARDQKLLLTPKQLKRTVKKKNTNKGKGKR